ncbi:GIY-YIG nuclease family protein [Staphylococcus americanisciuri]|uniref:GIY-YIG nuclease family protein n=1 Tax=Staphylococcus americanisciuri TaxID=2973940 RepID=A0ABT2F5D1_9STAP|nr:GIY-YIG nuclease family protein [Staphylococcus americanisciuri]MCS4487241.1 GIY-YIG nuclease family protein [Staphylococcus americanisciuri]
MADHYTYILECADHTLYTGYTTDLTARINKHNEGKGAKYTKTRRPVRLKHYEMYETKSEALKREHAIKKLTRQQKIALIEER